MHILCAEDDVQFMEVLQKIAKTKSFSMSCVSNGQDCLDYLMKQGKFEGSNVVKPDIILLDYYMPSMDGMGFLDEYKEKYIDNPIPVIFMSNTTIRSVRDKALQVGFVHLIEKPVNENEFEDLFNHQIPDVVKKHQQMKKGTKTLELCNFPLLVVDDNLIVRKMMTKIMSSKFDFTELRAAKDGQDAVNQFKELCEQTEHQPLIFMDLDMPILNGIGAIQEIRKIESQMNMSPSYICVLTANNDDDTKEEVFQVGANEFISKPIEKEQIFAIVEKRLQE